MPIFDKFPEYVGEGYEQYDIQDTYHDNPVVADGEMRIKREFQPVFIDIGRRTTATAVRLDMLGEEQIRLQTLDLKGDAPKVVDEAIWTPGHASEYRRRGTSFVIGRSEESNYVVPDPKASGKHIGLQIGARWNTPYLRVIDLGSLNSSFVTTRDAIPGFAARQPQ